MASMTVENISRDDVARAVALMHLHRPFVELVRDFGEKDDDGEVRILGFAPGEPATSAIEEMSNRERREGHRLLIATILPDGATVVKVMTMVTAQRFKQLPSDWTVADWIAAMDADPKQGYGAAGQSALVGAGVAYGAA